MLHFLSSRVQRDWRVFEFGSGNSSIWWAKRVEVLVSCENDEGWYLATKSRLTPNAEILLKDARESDYAAAARNFGGSFDVIVLDGRNRVDCAIQSLSALSERGVYIWDNSDRARYTEGYGILLSAGFRRLDFSGLGPINTTEWSTSVFYRDDNCLGI